MSAAGARARSANSRAMGHPSHQRAARVHRAAVTDAVTLYGWKLTERGYLGDGDVLGPCARCRMRHVRYGPTGKPLCPRCAP